MNFYHDDETARVNWIRELSLPFNVLSFNLAQATGFRMKDSRSKGFSDFGKAGSNFALTDRIGLVVK